MNTFLQLSNHGMFTPENEIAYVITDTSRDDSDDVEQFIDMAEEGFNLAFIYNMSSVTDTDCPGGLSCLVDDLGNTLRAGYDKTLKTELPLFEEFSLEEFELMRPSINNRHIQVARDMKEYMEVQGECNRCSKWMMATVETKTSKKVGKLEVGYWTPAGPYLMDDLFPHVKGNFRGRTIPVASVHVSVYQGLCLHYLSILSQYPPWQVLKKDNKGRIIETSGLIFEVLDQISYKLNFSYTVREPYDGQWGIRHQDGSWSGMIRQLDEKEVGFSIK